MIENRKDVAGILTLADVTRHHMDAQRSAVETAMRWRVVKENGDTHGEALLAASIAENEARRSLIEYEPLDREEGIAKLTYVSALILSGRQLEEGEASMVLRSVEALD